MKVKEIYEVVSLAFDKLDNKYQHKIPYVYALLGSLFMALASLIVKSNKQFPVYELLYFRSIFVLFFNIKLMDITGEKIYCEDKSTFKFLILRSLFSAGSSIFFFSSTQIINLGEATILYQTSPIWSNFVACIFFGEGFCFKTFIYTVISFGAIIFLLKPPFLFSETGDDAEFNPIQVFGQCLSLVGALFFAVMSNINKMLKGKTTKSQMILYIHVGSLIVSSILKTIFGYSSIDVFNYTTMGYIILFGLCAYCAQMCINQALFMKGANKIMPFNYSQVLFALIFDFCLFHKTIDIIQMVAGLIVMYCCFKIAVK